MRHALSGSLWKKEWIGGERGVRNSGRGVSVEALARPFFYWIKNEISAGTFWQGLCQGAKLYPKAARQTRRVVC